MAALVDNVGNDFDLEELDPSSPLVRIKVLIIDDDPDVVQVVSFCLERHWPEATVMSAVDGTEGLSLVRSQKPDIVILDIGMPEMNGFEVCRRIRKFSGVPVMVLTVRAANTDVERAFEAGADDYITKPFSNAGLSTRVQAMLQRIE